MPCCEAPCAPTSGADARQLPWRDLNERTPPPSQVRPSTYTKVAKARSWEESRSSPRSTCQQRVGLLRSHHIACHPIADRRVVPLSPSAPLRSKPSLISVHQITHAFLLNKIFTQVYTPPHAVCRRQETVQKLDPFVHEGWLHPHRSADSENWERGAHALASTLTGIGAFQGSRQKCYFTDPRCLHLTGPCLNEHMLRYFSFTRHISC